MASSPYHSFQAPTPTQAAVSRLRAISMDATLDIEIKPTRLYMMAVTLEKVVKLLEQYERVAQHLEKVLGDWDRDEGLEMRLDLKTLDNLLGR